MAKPLGIKSRLIRQAIAVHPGMGNTALAEIINAAPERRADQIKVTANDVAQQRQALKSPGAFIPDAAPQATVATTTAEVEMTPHSTPRTGKKRGRPKGSVARTAVAPVAARSTNQPQHSTELLEAMTAIKQLVDQLGASTVRGVVDLFDQAAGR